jgi:hypothetical protein
MTVDDLITALSLFPGDLRVRIAEADLLTFDDVAAIIRYRDTPCDPEWLVLRTG